MLAPIWFSASRHPLACESVNAGRSASSTPLAEFSRSGTDEVPHLPDPSPSPRLGKCLQILDAVVEVLGWVALRELKFDT
jgi:hypothetical protein